MAPVFLDASFEQPYTSYYNPDLSGTGWTTGGEASSGVVGPNPAFPTPPDGRQSGFCDPTAFLSQSLDFGPGGGFSLFGYYAAGSAGSQLAVSVDGLVVLTVVPPVFAFQRFQTPPFVVTPGSHVVTFTGLVGRVYFDLVSTVYHPVVTSSVARPARFLPRRGR